MKHKYLLSIILLMITLSALGATTYEVNGIYYQIGTSNGSSYAFVSYGANPYKGIVNIPSSVKIGDRTYPVKSIGYQAFQNDPDLITVNIPNSVTGITESAFSFSGLQYINLPSSIKTIKGSAFASCTKLSSIELPNSLTQISDYTFQSCTGLKRVFIPASVTSIIDKAFKDCTSLDTIEAASLESWCQIQFASSCDILKNAHHFIVGGKDITKELTFPTTINSINQYAFYQYQELESITIPGTITNIGQGAFMFCTNLNTVNISEGLTTLGTRAFWGCSNLVFVNLTNGVSSIDGYAFNDCAKLSTVILPQSITSVSYGIIDKSPQLYDLY